MSLSKLRRLDHLRYRWRAAVWQAKATGALAISLGVPDRRGRLPPGERPWSLLLVAHGLGLMVHQRPCGMVIEGPLHG